jgi:GT2 family glycosyltransferase
MSDVGVVMPVYKQKPSYLRRALQSILAQQYRHFTLVIVVDGAPFDVLPVIRETVQNDPRVRVVILPENQGVAKALNRGFQELFSLPGIEYLTWISSDNIYFPDFLLTLRTCLRSAPPEVGVVYSCFQEIDEAGKPLRDEAFLDARRKYQQRRKEELLDFHFIGVSFMYKAAYARLIGGYGQEPVEDYDYFLRLTEHCEVRYIPSVLMEYRVNSPLSISAQMKRSKEQHRRWRYMFQLVKQQARMRRGIPPEMTVLFPVTDGTARTVESYENLLEQYYSNYQVIVLDQTPQKQATRVLQSISDPRVGFFHVPGGARTAMHAMLKQIRTPFVLFFANGPPMGYYTLHSMAQTLRAAENQRILAAFLPANGSGVQLRDHPAPFEPVFFHLYRTSRLLEAWQNP